MQQVRGEELFFSDAGAAITTRSPAGDITAPIHHSDRPAEVLSGIQGTSLLHVRVSSHSAFGRLT